MRVFIDVDGMRVIEEVNLISVRESFVQHGLYLTFESVSGNKHEAVLDVEDVKLLKRIIKHYEFLKKEKWRKEK